jgi:hypothetical protein
VLNCLPCSLNLLCASHTACSGGWAGQTKGLTVEAQPAVVESFKDCDDAEAVAKEQKKLELVITAQKRRSDGGEYN